MRLGSWGRRGFGARRRLVGIAVALAGAALITGSSAAAQSGSGGPAFTAPSRADDPAVEKTQGSDTYVSEPATAIDKNGARYVAYQADSQISVSHDGGRTWAHPGGIDALTKNNEASCVSAADVGDVELATAQSGRVYFADLQATVGGSPDTGVEPHVARSDDGFKTYQTACSAHQPFSVDREWMAAYTPPGADADHELVYMTYHDFGPDAMWVNVSKDGGKTWSSPTDVITDANAATTSACDTVPAGISVDPRNGWVYVAWTAGAGPVTNAGTGCNYTQGTVFNNYYVAVSKDQGATWSATLAYSGPGPTAASPLDMSEIFASVGVSRQGDVAIAFPGFLGGEFGAFYASSPAADDSGHLHFTAPTKVNGSDVHTAYFTRLVTGDSGRVDLIYLGSPTKNVIATPANKTAYTGSDPNQPNCSPELTDPSGHGVRFPGKPCQLPDNAPWYLYLAQTVDGATASPHFANQRLRADPVHTGDICTLGIFCLPGDDRDLADVNDVRIDAYGGAQIAYTAETPDRKHTEIDFQCQTGGTGLYAGTAVRSCLLGDYPAAVAAAAPTSTGGGGNGEAPRGSLPTTGGGSSGLGWVLLAVGGALALLRRKRPSGRYSS